MMRYIRCHCLDMMASTFHDGIFHDRQNVGLPHKACPVIIGMLHTQQHPLSTAHQVPHCTKCIRQS